MSQAASQAPESETKSKKKGCIFWGVVVLLALVGVVLVWAGGRELQRRHHAAELAQGFVDENCGGGEVVDVTSGEVQFDMGCDIQDVRGYIVEVDGCDVYETVEIGCPYLRCVVSTGRSVAANDCGTMF